MDELVKKYNEEIFEVCPSCGEGFLYQGVPGLLDARTIFEAVLESRVSEIPCEVSVHATPLNIQGKLVGL